MHDLSGKTVLITGAGGGIGRVTAEALAKAGARVFVHARSQQSAAPVVDGILATGALGEAFVCDLGDLHAVSAAVDKFLEHEQVVHALVNNAGIGGQRGQTSDGFELHFGINHLSHFLLTRRLEPLLLAAPEGARVLNVASKAHYIARAPRWEQLERKTRTFTGFSEYSFSKLANVLFARSLARRWSQERAIAISLHPGVVASGIWRRLPKPVRWLYKRSMLSVEQGAQTQINLALAPLDELDSGAYYHYAGARKPSALALDESLADELCKRSEDWLTDRGITLPE